MAHPLEFYDLKTGQKFVTRDYITLVTRKGMLMAKCTAPSVSITTRIIGKS